MEVLQSTCLNLSGLHGTTRLFSAEFRQPMATTKLAISVKRRLFSAAAWVSRRSSSSYPRLAVGSNAAGADTDDEMIDDLLKKYGEVVYNRNDQKQQQEQKTAEIDDDAESLSFAVAVAKIASEVKAGDIRVLFVKPLVYWTRFFIIATAYSRPQIDAIGSRIRDLAEKEYGKVATGDVKPNSWTLLDYGDVVVHVFLPPQRSYYNLEEFYGNAMSVDLPFEQQPPRN